MTDARQQDDDGQATGAGRVRYSSALAAVVRRSAIPYGYTLTIWTSGAAVERSHGTPTVGDTFLFLGGAIAGFAALGLLVQIERQSPLDPQRGDLIRTGLTQLIAVGTALGAVSLVALIHSFAVWPMAGFATTVIYLAVAAVELAMTARTVHRGDAS